MMLEPTLPQGPSNSDAARPLSGFSPFEDTSRTSFISEGPGKFAESTSAHHQELRERMPFTPPTEHGSFQDTSSDNGVGFSAAKGSRFAKFFDGKGRDGGHTVAKPHGPVGFASSSPGPNSGQMQDHFNGVSGGPTDHRTMDDIYAMLNSSSQVGTFLPLLFPFVPSFDRVAAEPKRSHWKHPGFCAFIPCTVWSTSAA
jgi:hypothetical protein